jgi:hypothetical protein
MASTGMAKFAMRGFKPLVVPNFKALSMEPHFLPVFRIDPHRHGFRRKEGVPDPRTQA